MRKASWFVAAAVVAGFALAGPAGATVTVATTQVGNVAATGTTLSSTACPDGAFATGIVVHTLSSDNYVRGVQLVCSDGTTTAFAGGVNSNGENVATTACTAGDHAVGVGGRYGAVVDAISTRCVDSTNTVYDAATVGSTGGSTMGPADCPAGTELVGISVWWGDYLGEDTVKSTQGACGSVTGQVGNVAATGTTLSSTACPDGAFATGIVVHTLSSDNYVRGVQLVCSDGTTTAFAGGVNSNGENVATTACTAGDHAVGVGGRYGAVVDAISTRCVDSTNTVYDAATVGSTGGSTMGPADCAADTQLIGVAVWWGDYLGEDTVKSIAGMCAPETTAPTRTLDALPAAILSSSLPLSWSGADTGSGLAYYQLRYQVAADTSTFGAWQYPAAWQHLTGTQVTASGLTFGHDYCFALRAIDNAGNASTWTTPACAARAVDDRTLTASTHWRRATATRWWNGTATTTKTRGAMLRLAKLRLDRIGVVATQCPTCGNVAIYVGATRIGGISLAKATTANRQVLMLPRFSLREGTVSIKVTSTAKSVQIDGLVTSRT